MKLGRKVRPEIEIQVTSIADMAFLLLIFFVKTTTLARDMGTQMQIPATAPGEQKGKDKTITILLNAGTIKFDRDGSSAEVSIAELRQKLKDEKFAARPPEQRVVIVEGQENVDYQAFYSVIAAVDAAGGITTLMTDMAGGSSGGDSGGTGGNGAAAAGPSGGGGR